MMELTWNEFKKFVDHALEEQGVDGDIAIWYIDVSFPQPDGIQVSTDDNCGLAIGG